MYTVLDLLCTAPNCHLSQGSEGAGFPSLLPLVGHILAYSKIRICCWDDFLRSWKSSQKGLVTETSANRTSKHPKLL